MKNGTVWLDDRGKSIQAHGGMIAKFGDTYYWYGEDKGLPTTVGPDGRVRIAFKGISCYTSRDLSAWHYEGPALIADETRSVTDLSPEAVCERPKVLYNARTKRYVMWMHIDNSQYSDARAGIAVSESPLGPFTYLRGIRPNVSDCRDMTLFQDDDGCAYLFHSSDWNRTLHVSQLDADYTGVTGVFRKIFPEQFREAPAVLRSGGAYFIITSGCTGWAPNAALYGKACHPLGEWRLIDNPCVGPDSRKTFLGQSACVFFANGSPCLLLDHWNRTDLGNSGYSIVPVSIDDECMTVPWQENSVCV